VPARSRAIAKPATLPGTPTERAPSVLACSLTLPFPSRKDVTVVLSELLIFVVIVRFSGAVPSRP